MHKIKQKISIFPSKFIFIKTLFFLLFFLFSCQTLEKKNSPFIFSGEAMTISFRILIGDSLSTKQQKEIEKSIVSTFSSVHEFCNIWNPKSEISQWNEKKEIFSEEISPILFRLVQETDEIINLTEGRFDPSIAPLQAIWKKAFLKNELPKEEEIFPLKEVIGWKNVEIGKGKLGKKHPFVQLDFGGIAKGYLVDLLIESLQNLAIQNAYIEWGGEIRCIGHHPSGRNWKIYIRSSKSSDINYSLGITCINNAAIATSGNYFQSWKIKNNFHYTHIFDPKIYKPLEINEFCPSSVSVIASTCLKADGIATAAMTFTSKKQASDWLQSLQEQKIIRSFWVE